MASCSEYLVTYPQPRFLSNATGTHRVPDFDVSEVIINNTIQSASRRPLLTVEQKAPPRNINENSMEDAINTTTHQLEIQVSHLFASPHRPNHVIGVAGVGTVWKWVLYVRSERTPTRRHRESIEDFISRFLDSDKFGQIDSNLFDLGTPGSNQKLGRLPKRMHD